MSILDRFLSRPEKRAHDPSWAALADIDATGQAVNARTAENLATILAAVQAISGSISALPARVHLLGRKGRQLAPDHPVSRLISDGPNAHQNWCDFMEWLIASALLRGNGLAEIVTEGGAVVELKPIPWQHVGVQLLPAGRLVYDISDTTGGGRRRLLEGEVLHLKDRSDDGLVGRSRLSRAAKTISAALSLQDHAGAMLANGVYPSGTLEAEGKLSTEALSKLKDLFKAAFSGPNKAGKALVLDQGIKWNGISPMSPEDAELLGSRRFSGEEIARIYNIPPAIVGDLTHGTFTNSETAGRWFAQHTLTPWICKIEAEFRRSVFSAHDRAAYGLDIDLSGMLRGDPETRWKSHKIARDADILDINEIREIEGFNPRPATAEVVA